ncbi:MAG TPA: type II toxin-antitoxin system VapC family toxin [Candidatus Agrococcus pullicola]|uniref:Type II toxin-antitoxin system VapC family toxin n=1 Tax=Candidatus Agrococcus pullicola TaxID=2838429 RepID=A0A9D1YVR9_9MICO|nr:type II toxin-antitoxin system VapC family toxin [Candidatus Agrococcus pullicola]
MRLLLDTHVYLWVRADSDRLPLRFREAIADPRNMKFISSLSTAEIAVKRAVGKLDFDGPMHRPLVELGFDELSFSHEHARVLDSLPLKHRDPFDRMLIAQAIAEGLTLVTVDAKFSQYDVSLLPSV